MGGGVVYSVARRACQGPRGSDRPPSRVRVDQVPSHTSAPAERESMWAGCDVRGPGDVRDIGRKGSPSLVPAHQEQRPILHPDRWLGAREGAP
eukprot:scaffold298742_cov33-Tisochrysis_lutea.AAC.2